MGEIRQNVGYQIIETVKINDVEFVLGEKQDAVCSKYVTWYCKNNEEYNFGHYFNDKQKAQLNLYHRALKELGFRVKILKEQSK